MDLINSLKKITEKTIKQNSYSYVAYKIEVKQIAIPPKKILKNLSN